MSKLPAIQFYVGDWRKDAGIQSMDYFARGLWFEFLCVMHESDRRGYLLINGKKPTNEQLVRLFGLDKQILTTHLSLFLDVGVASQEEDTGVLFNRRMVRDEEIRRVRAECGKKGGNPALVNQKPTTGVKQSSTTGVKVLPTPSVAVAVSASALKTETDVPTGTNGNLDKQKKYDLDFNPIAIWYDLFFKAYRIKTTVLPRDKGILMQLANGFGKGKGDVFTATLKKFLDDKTLTSSAHSLKILSDNPQKWLAYPETAKLDSSGRCYQAGYFSDGQWCDVDPEADSTKPNTDGPHNDATYDQIPFADDSVHGRATPRKNSST